MNELASMDDYGVFADKHDTARVSSRNVAELFRKSHAHVLRDIKNLDCSDNFRKSNFGFSAYINVQGKKDKEATMTRDGFMFLAMGYRGKRAAAIKEAYIRKFNEMESFIRTLVETRQEFPLLTANIKLIHENPKPYHFSNEADMLNCIVLGMTAKEFRTRHGLNHRDSIRPHLTAVQISALDTLQKVDIGLLLAMPDFNQRKRQLQWYFAQSVKTDGCTVDELLSAEVT